MTDVEQALRTEIESVRGALQEAQARITELETRLSEAESTPVTPLPHFEAPYYRALDHLMEGCQIIGFDWRYLYLNDAAVRHGQQTRESLIGYTMMERYPGIETTDMFALLRRCMEERIPHRMENEFVYPDGTLGWFELSIQPVPEGIFILSLDITERKRMDAELRQNERRYRNVVEDQAELICRYDHNLNLTFVNQAYSAVYGKTPEAMIGTNILTLIVPEQREAAIAHVLTLNADNPVAITEHRTLMPDGSTRWFQWQDRALLDSAGYITEYQGVGRDITKQKLAEQELEALYNATSYLFQADSLDTLAHQIVETVVQEFEHADCGLMLVDADDHTISRIARAGVYDVHPIAGLTLNGTGLVPLAIRTGSTVHVPDVTLDSRYLESDSRTRSELVVPLKTGRGVIGALDLQRAEVGAFSERDQRILTAYAERAAVAVENMQLYEQVNTYAVELEKRVQERTAELMYAKERVEAILNNSVDAIVLADIHFSIRQTNAAFNRLFACETDDYFGQQLSALAIPTDVKFIRTAVQVRQIEPAEKSIEFRARRKDGTTFDAEFSVGAVKTEGVVCTIRDVTERKRAEQALRESEEKFRQLVKAAPIAVVMTDSTGQVILFNDQAEILFGYERHELLGQAVEVLLPEAIRQSHVRHREGYVAAPRTRQMGIGLELLARRKNEGEFPVEIQLGYIETQTGLMVMSFIADITERKARERQFRYDASVQASIHDAVIATDMDFVVRSWNPAAERIYGWSANEVIGRPINDTLHTKFTSDASREMIVQQFLEQGHWTDEVMQYRKDGSTVHILSSTVLFKDESGKPFGIVAVNHDITERKKAESALKARMDAEMAFQKDLKTLHDITIDLTLIDDLDEFYKCAVMFGLSRLGFERLGLLLYDSEHEQAVGTYGTDANGLLVAEHNLRLSPSDLTGILARAWDEDARFVVDDNVTLFSKLEPVGTGWNAVAVLWHGSERLGWLAADNGVHHRPLNEAQLDILFLYGLTLGSLMAGKRVQSDLSMSEARYRLLANNATDLVMQSNTAAEFVYVSPSVRAMLGYDSAELLGVVALEFVHPDDLEQTQRALARTMEPDLPKVEITMRFRHKDGHYVWMEVIGQAIHSDETGEAQGFIAAGRDITERKIAEDALRRAFAKEKELGELKSRFVSMASHEFRTPLATILALTETVIAYRKRLTDEQLDERLYKIQDQVGHLKDIMEDVLQLARLQARRMEFNPVLLDLDSLCRSVMHEFESRPEVTQQFVYRCDEALREVVLDKKLMRQIINNLLSNAVKYSPDHSTVNVMLTVAEGQVVLTVQDEGIGIPEPDIKHLFTPFHRATNVGTISGTGLGLVIIKESVELHGGTIEVDSKVGGGTTFTVKIPVMEQARAEGVES